MEIKIGDKVRFEHAVFGNMVGTVKEIFDSPVLSTKAYNVHVRMSDGIGRAFVVSEEDIRLAEKEPEISSGEFEIKLDVADNIVVAILFKNGEEIARGHGHIIHGGDMGIAQAISYATKRIWFALGGGYDDK